MPGRDYNAEKYRYGFNGHEMLNEIYGLGNLLLSENWEYSSRLGRRFETDPVTSPHLSPYACFADNPIWFKDPNGADTSIANNNKGNIIVWITESGDEVDYKKEAKQQNWDIIEAKNATEAELRLKEYSKTNKINNLVIRTHGFDRTAESSFAMDGFSVDAKDVNNYVNGKEISPSKKEFLDGISKMQNMVETGGSVYYTACNAGYDRKLVGAMGGLLLKADQKNVSLYFNTGRSQFNKPQFSLNSRSNQSTVFDQPLLHPSSSGSIWISINKSQQNVIFHFWKTSPGLKADSKNPIGNYIYK